MINKKKLLVALRSLAVEPFYDPDWDGVAGTFNVEKLANYIISIKSRPPTLTTRRSK